jgi:hypothetical protein
VLHSQMTHNQVLAVLLSVGAGFNLLGLATVAKNYADGSSLGRDILAELEPSRTAARYDAIGELLKDEGVGHMRRMEDSRALEALRSRVGSHVSAHWYFTVGHW